MIYFLFIIIIFTPLIIWGANIKRTDKEMSIRVNAEYNFKLSRLEEIIENIMGINEFSVNQLGFMYDCKHSARNLYSKYERYNKDAKNDIYRTANMEVLREAINFLDSALEKYDPIVIREKAIEDLLDD